MVQANSALVHTQAGSALLPPGKHLLNAAGRCQTVPLLGCFGWPHPSKAPTVERLTTPTPLPAGMATRATRGLYLRHEVAAACSCAAGQSLADL